MSGIDHVELMRNRYDSECSVNGGGTYFYTIYKNWIAGQVDSYETKKMLLGGKSYTNYKVNFHGMGKTDKEQLEDAAQKMFVTIGLMPDIPK